MSELNHEPAAVLYARQQAGFTQAQAVELLSPIINSKGHLSEIENGTRSASAALIARMAEVYKCPRVILVRNRWADQ